MNAQNQLTSGISLSAEQLQEVISYLGEQPARIVNPVLNFLLQLQAQQAPKEEPKSKENDTKEEAPAEEGKRAIKKQ